MTFSNIPIILFLVRSTIKVRTLIHLTLTLGHPTDFSRNFGRKVGQ